MSTGIDIHWLGGNCPVQAEGTFDGVAFYFRARGTSVTCDVGDWMWEGPTYEWPDAGWISENLARAYIEQAYADYRRREERGPRKRRNDDSARRMSHLKWAGVLANALGEEAAPVVAWHMAEAKRITDIMNQRDRRDDQI